MSDNEQRVIFIFPGQGSQYPGIGSDLHAEFESARRIYQEASDLLGMDMPRLSFEDPDNRINLTRYTQPVLLTHQIAWQPFASAGHSLGEYSALVAAGVLTFGDALKLVAKRGELMGEHGEGEMLALTVDLETARPMADKHHCGIAGLNLPDQTVVGGAGSDLEALAAEMGEKYPKKRAVPLKTEGAFHTYYMVTAARLYREELARVTFSEPTIKALSNYTGGYHEADADSIRSRLFFQLFHPVNWIGCLQTALDDGASLFVEFGGGIGKGEGPAEKRPNLESIIKKFTRRADPKPEYLSAINVESIRATAGRG
jgi:[acyl-carrier-protein] S-malonyltransferase